VYIYKTWWLCGVKNARTVLIESLCSPKIHEPKQLNSGILHSALLTEKEVTLFPSNKTKTVTESFAITKDDAVLWYKIDPGLMHLRYSLPVKTKSI
jgi:hypothetical protein